MGKTWNATRGSWTHRLLRAAFSAACGLMTLALVPCVAECSTQVSFNRDIRPILSNYCFTCHGPDEAERQGGTDGLRLDTEEGTFADLGGYTAITRGKPEESELLRRLKSDDPYERMPPEDDGKKLDKREIDLFEEWIRQGAAYERHWSYIKPTRPPLPNVEDASWSSNEIDYFVLARLEQQGLKPAPPADPYALVRRVSLDLTGLPPTIEQADDFAADTRRDAYERLVDRLLASDAYGEHWARKWLDLARYADSAGYADDPPRTIWYFRDYVIRSLNANKPFDLFTIEQIAGDLLEDYFRFFAILNGTQDADRRDESPLIKIYSPEQKEERAAWQAEIAALEEKQEDSERLAALRKQLDDMKPYTTLPVMVELAEDKQRKTNVQYRGSFLDLGPEVAPAVPAAFHPLPEKLPPNRLALAKWLIDDDNPLTPRVIANRYWEQIFGAGIVRTSEDFGAQGDQPTHPELLDWLATELVGHDWDLKHLLKAIVMSSTYRQSSRVTATALEADPDNRLLSRGPRFRLSAETVRDQALFASGLLSPKMYGPPVRPPRPTFGLKAAFGGSTDWTTSVGADRHRRAVYTEWRRSLPYPSMATFDAPNREVCTIRRERTNTPLQALVTLNDPVYVEAAQALARRMVDHEGKTDAKARFGFRLCVSRAPEEKELNRLVHLYETAYERFEMVPDQAGAMATDPLGPAPEGADLAELAAWTVVGNVLLNLDETLMKR